MASENTTSSAGSSTPQASKGSWRKTIVTVVVLAGLVILAWREPQFTGEVIVGFLGVLGIHSQTQP